MSFTQADYDSINKAIASGLTEASIGGQVVKYQRTSDLLAARTVIKADLVASGLLTATERTSVAVFSKGL